MTEVVVAMCAGVLAGFVLKKKTRLLRAASTASSAAVFVLLLLLGLGIGSNGEVLRSLPRLGLRAALISFAAIAGSVACASLLSRFLRKEKRREG